MDPGDRFCRQCGRALVFVEIAVWKQFALAVGALIGLVLLLGGIVLAVEGIESGVETAVVEAAGGYDYVAGADCSELERPAGRQQKRYSCTVDPHSGPCERWSVIFYKGSELRATYAEVADC